MKNEREVTISLSHWNDLMEIAGRQIDPKTAEVTFEWGSVRDPYGVRGIRKEEDNIGRNYFARNPGSSIWVSWGDLPEATRIAMTERKDAGEIDDLSWLFC